MSGAGGTTTAARLLIHASRDVPVDTPRGPAREAAKHELSKPMYHENDPNLLQRGLDRLWGWLGDLFATASNAAPGGPLGLIVLVAVILGLAAALWWRLGTPQRTTRPLEALFDDSPRSAAEHRTAAEAHAVAERWNEAVQERMRAIVRSLEERALLDPRPGRTADEAAAEAGRSLPAHEIPLRGAARDFDDVTYGGRTADRHTYLAMQALDLDIENAKPRLTTAARGAAE
ncbi:DUF4129 domain-containing protein [Streptomyces sp. NPDC005318]|uniref:DUF4129 domain-containing protein n=1 Tax=Streptomyces sp. NPDC005318 TaxID=3157031 RepID=UPI0033B1539F